MITKPTMKTNIAIRQTNPQDYYIALYMTSAYAILIGDIDGMLLIKGSSSESCSLIVDPRYDFNEVVEYIKKLGETNTLFAFTDNWQEAYWQAH